MSYADDFYVKENIIGYTGTLTPQKKEDFPTVYFADAGGLNPRTTTVDGQQQVLVKYGHITQWHPLSNNIGREKVFENYSYGIINVKDKDGKEHAQEFILGKERNLPKEWADFHTSRNRFEQATAGNRDMLAQAIERFPELKQRYK